MFGGGNMQGMMKKVQKMQKDMKKMQDELKVRTVEATVGWSGFFCCGNFIKRTRI